MISASGTRLGSAEYTPLTSVHIVIPVDLYIHIVLEYIHVELEYIHVVLEYIHVVYILKNFINSNIQNNTFM